MARKYKTTLKTVPYKFHGFTEAELAIAFSNVQNPHDWKAPIFAEVPAEELGVTIAAIVFYTATEPKVRPVREGVFSVDSIGYRQGPAGDH